MSHHNWSTAEKKIARRVFEAALAKELASLMAQLKTRAAGAETPDDIWALNDYLTKRRNQIDRKYDYRYSQLVVVFGQLLREGLIEEKDIEGLAVDKLEAIRRFASL